MILKLLYRNPLKLLIILFSSEISKFHLNFLYLVAGNHFFLTVVLARSVVECLISQFSK